MNQECECNILHQEKIDEVKKNMLSEDILIDISELFKVLGDSTRMKIICSLMEGELCVCDITNITNSTQSAISHQLRILKQAKLVKSRRDGKIIYYSLDDNHVEKLFKLGCEHVEEI